MAEAVAAVNSARIDFLSPAEVALIRSDVAGLMSDPQAAVAVTYRDFAGRTFTPETGAYAESYADSAGLRALRNVLKTSEVVAGAGVYQAGDVRFMFDRAALTLTPAREDLIVEGADTHQVVTWNTDPLGAIWNIVARKVASA